MVYYITKLAKANLKKLRIFVHIFVLCHTKNEHTYISSLKCI